MIEANGWDNHEDTFEEIIRRELLAAQQTIYVLKEDNKELTKAYYILLKENVQHPISLFLFFFYNH